jgi:hypothetical protein
VLQHSQYRVVPLFAAPDLASLSFRAVRVCLERENRSIYLQEYFYLFIFFIYLFFKRETCATGARRFECAVTNHRLNM